MKNGKILKFNIKSGQGYISCKEGLRYFSYNNLLNKDKMKSIIEGKEVVFDEHDIGVEVIAINIEIIDVI